MLAVEPYLKTQRLAKALGVSVSTVKRWVDSGTIRAARTVGRHRLIPFSEALRLAREQGFPEANLEILTGLGTRGAEVGPEAAVAQLEKMLRECRAPESKTFINSLHKLGWNAV